MAQTNQNIPAGNTNPNAPTVTNSEITVAGKTWAGILLVFFTAATLILIIGYWPDRMPSPRAESAQYIGKFFYVSLYSQTDSASIDTIGKEVMSTERIMPSKRNMTGKICLIDLNTLIMILIALGGFLGSMVHIGSSLTNFVGADKFRKRWVLWYCVKPFTAAALAIGVYIIFRAGFLNGTNSTTNINLYGVVSIAILTGLFTDKATKKLGQIFDVIFQTNIQPLPDPLDLAPIKVTKVLPEQLTPAGSNNIVLSGSGFDKQKYVVKINGQEITGVAATENSLSFAYTTPNPVPDSGIELVIFDEKYNTVYTKKLTVAPTPPMPQLPVPTIKVDSVEPTSITAGTPSSITINGSGLSTTGVTVKMDIQDIDMATATVLDTAITFSYTAIAAAVITMFITDGEGNKINETIITVS